MRTIINELRQLAKKHYVNVKFINLTNGVAGTVSYAKNTIFINRLNSSRSEILTAFFHELMHIHCYRNNIWKQYHKSRSIKTKLKTALKCERWIDKKASELLKEYDPTVTYYFAYNEEGAAEFLRDYYRNYHTKYASRAVG